jgi:hypothetical protein
MKRYLLFGFYRYYPDGGLDDIIADFNDINELNLDELYYNYDHYQLLDLKTQKQSHLQMSTIEHEIEEKEIYDYDEEEKYKKNAIINWLKKNVK